MFGIPAVPLVVALLVALVVAAVVISPFFWSGAAGPAVVLAEIAWRRRRDASR